MTSTTFVDKVTVITAAWAQDTNDHVYETYGKHSITPYEFGAVGDGSAVDTTAVQAAIDFGRAEVLIPEGTYLCSTLTLVGNFRLRGTGPSSILKFSETSGNNAFLRVENVSDVVIEDLTIDMNDSVGTDGLGASAILHRATTSDNAADNITLRRVRFIGGTIRAYVDFRSAMTQRGVRIEDCEFLGKATLTPQVAPAAQTTQGIRFLISGAGCGDWHITGNTAQSVGNFLQIRRASSQQFGFYDSITVTGNRIWSVLDDPNVSTSPYEIQSVDGAAVTGNTIHTGGRGFNFAYCRGATLAGNSAYDQTRYFCEIQSVDGLTISGNTATNCKTLVNDTSATPGSKNVTITSNVCNGGSIGEVGYDDGDFANAITMVFDTDGYENWIVSNNIFSGLLYQDSVIRIDGASTSRVLIEHNVIMDTSETCRPRCISIVNGSDVTVRGNELVREADITDATVLDDAIYALITVSSSSGSGIVVEGNRVRWRGTDARTGGHASGLIGIGTNDASGPLAKSAFFRNVIEGDYTNPLRLPYTSGDTVVEDNDLTQATGSNSFNAAIVYKRERRYVEGGAAPTSGTWAVGDHCANSTPAVGQPKGWFCTVAGTPGTWVSEGNL